MFGILLFSTIAIFWDIVCPCLDNEHAFILDSAT